MHTHLHYHRGESDKKKPVQSQKVAVREASISAEEWLRQARVNGEKSNGKKGEKPRKLEVLTERRLDFLSLDPNPFLLFRSAAALFTFLARVGD